MWGSLYCTLDHPQFAPNLFCHLHMYVSWDKKGGLGNSGLENVFLYYTALQHDVFDLHGLQQPLTIPH